MADKVLIDRAALLALADEWDKESNEYPAKRADPAYGWVHKNCAKQLRALTASQQPVVDDDLKEVGRLIATQDNRITEARIFIVQQRREHVAHADYDCDRIVWVDGDGEAPADKVAALDAEYDETGSEPDGWRRLALGHTWEFVTACFTEQGCKDYLARDGHNLKETRIYASGSYRNSEWRTVRDYLLSLNDAAIAATKGEG